MLSKLIRFIRQSFSAQIVSLVGASVLVTAIVVGFASTHSTEQFLTDKTSEKFPSILSQANFGITSWYDQHYRDLERLCESRGFRDNLDKYLLSPRSQDADVGLQEDMSKYFTLVKEKLPIYDDLLVLGEKGSPIAYSSERVKRSAGEVWGIIQESGESARFSRAIMVSGGTGFYQWLFVPIKDGERTAATMVARVDLRALTSMLSEIAVASEGDLYLLNANGLYLTQPRFVPDNLLGKLAKWAPTRQQGPPVMETKKNDAGRKVFHSVVRLNNSSWWLVYEEDYKDAMVPVSRTQRRIWMAIVIISAIFTLVALKLVKSILKPILGLAEGAVRINDGMVGVSIPPGGSDEIGMMIETFNEMAKAISLSKAELQYKNKMLNTQNDELSVLNQKLEELSITDGLTGLFNHRHFWNILNTELARVDLYQGELALVLVDLDDFKLVNDRFGHSVGDLLLQSVARILKRKVRDTDIVARYGGEEFAILLPDTDRMGVENVSEKVRACVETLRFKVPETDITLAVTVSVGVSVFRGNRREFFNSADEALYQSKSEGKNRVNFAAA